MHNPAARSLPGQHSCGPAGTGAATPGDTLCKCRAVGRSSPETLQIFFPGRGPACRRGVQHHQLLWNQFVHLCSCIWTVLGELDPFLILLMSSLSTGCPHFVVPPALQVSVQPRLCWATVSAADLVLQMQMFFLHGVPTEQELPEGALWGEDYELRMLHIETLRAEMLMCISDGAQH